MKITNLINNVNKQILSIMSSVWNWFNGLLIGSVAVAAAFAITAFYALCDDGKVNITYGVKKKK